jgi:hypothetical protein
VVLAMHAWRTGTWGKVIGPCSHSVWVWPNPHLLPNSICPRSVGRTIMVVSPLMSSEYSTGLRSRSSLRTLGPSALQRRKEQRWMEECHTVFSSVRQR